MSAPNDWSILTQALRLPHHKRSLTKGQNCCLWLLPHNASDRAQDMLWKGWKISYEQSWSDEEKGNAKRVLVIWCSSSHPKTIFASDEAIQIFYVLIAVTLWQRKYAFPSKLTDEMWRVFVLLRQIFARKKKFLWYQPLCLQVSKCIW